MITEIVQVKTLRPILDSYSGIVVVPENTIGDLVDYAITPGPAAFIPTKGLFDPQLTRRLLFTISFPQGVFHLTFPEQMEFVTEHGLLKALMTSETILKVESTSPTPRFRSSIVRPLAATICLSNGLKVTFILDKVSGYLDIELEAEEA